MASSGPEDNLTYDLPRELDLLAAVNLKSELVSLWQKEGNLMVDGSSVERVSTPCVEVLVAASVAYSDIGKAFNLSKPSDSLRDAFEALGLADRLEMWRAS